MFLNIPDFQKKIYKDVLLFITLLFTATIYTDTNTQTSESPDKEDIGVNFMVDGSFIISGASQAQTDPLTGLNKVIAQHATDESESFTLSYTHTQEELKRLFYGQIEN